VKPQLLYGLETEYGFSQFSERGEALDRDLGAKRLLSLARSAVECLPDLAGQGVFLGNGGRLYVDAGHHPELCTPECSDPWQLVRYVRAGEILLTQLARALDEREPGLSTLLFRSNVDYDSLATWGCHESYQYSARQEAMATELIPHLVSRIVYTGAGGLDPRSPGISFMLSPRVAHLSRVISDSSTGDRGIFHTKDEMLAAGGHHRLHILVGESLCGELGTFLKVGATALVVRLIEAGVCHGEQMRLSGPLASMRSLAADPACKRRVHLKSRRRLTAIEIQRHYLEKAEAQLGQDFMPSWAEEVCRIWRGVLDRLEGWCEGDGAATSTIDAALPRSAAEQAAPVVSSSLDWAIKHRLFLSQIRRRGFDEARLARLNALAHDLSRIVVAEDELDRRRQRDRLMREPVRGDRALRDRFARHVRRARATRSLSSLLGDVHLGRAMILAMTPALIRHQVTFEELRRFVQLRAELCEIDARFGQLGEQGIFESLRRAGVLDEAIPGIGDVKHAVTEPPPTGRAHLRGAQIRSHAGSSRHTASWSGIHDHERDRVYDLSDPFGHGAHWRGEDVLGEGFEAAGRDNSLRARLARLRRDSDVPF